MDGGARLRQTETAEFWRNGRRVQKGETRPEDIATEVFFLPASMPGEKEGTVTNTSRLVQWHDHVCEAPGDSRSDLWFMYHLGVRLKQMYAGSQEPRDQAIQNLTWSYPTKTERMEPDAEAILKEINGYTVADRKQIAKYQELKDDGSTACGGWMYCGVYPEEDKNKARERMPDTPETSPTTRAGPSPGRPTAARCTTAPPPTRTVSRGRNARRWSGGMRPRASGPGCDVPDFEPTKRPDYRPDWSKQPHGMDAIGGADPFIMEADGQCMIFVPSGLKDGPLPTYYEPVESPVRNSVYGQQISPTAKIWKRKGNEIHKAADPRFPHIFTTYRLTELHCGGIPTRIMPHTAELQPEAFVEISPELARELGVKSLDWTVLSTIRGGDRGQVRW